jgi:hypothetical protein
LCHQRGNFLRQVAHDSGMSLERGAQNICDVPLNRNGMRGMMVAIIVVDRGETP